MEGWGKGWRGEERKAVISSVGRFVVMEKSNLAHVCIHTIILRKKIMHQNIQMYTAYKNTDLRIYPHARTHTQHHYVSLNQGPEVPPL